MIMSTGLEWSLLDKPANWKKIFENDHPVDCEIGFGNAEFLINKAKSHLERNFFGIDYSSEFFTKAEKVIKRANSTNVKVVCLEAKAAFMILIPQKSLSHIYINFPDPWPKKKHRKNRLLDREFFTLAASRVAKEGKVIIVTDDPFYCDFILEEIGVTHLWKSLFQKGWTNEISDYYPTKYEKKWKAQGKDIFYMIFQKKKDPDKEFKMKEYNIKDVVFSTHFPSRISNIAGEIIKEGNSIARILQIKRTAEEIKILVLLKDDTLIRKRILPISESKNNQWKLQIPENLFPSFSFKIFIDKLKTLDE